jgi:hypothetical protein
MSGKLMILEILNDLLLFDERENVKNAFPECR